MSRLPLRHSCFPSNFHTPLLDIVVQEFCFHSLYFPPFSICCFLPEQTQTKNEGVAVF